MMSASLEERLLAGYSEQLRRYDRAAALLDEVPSQGAETSGAEPWAHALHALLQEAAAIAATMAADVASWRQARCRPGPELHSVLERLGRRVQGLSRSIDQRIDGLRARQQQLVPEMDAVIDKRRMLRAYTPFTA